MNRLPILPPLRDSIPCPLRAGIGIALGLAISLGITRGLLWLVAAWTPAEVREELDVVWLLLTGVIFVATLAVMGSVVQRSAPLRHFFGWCSDDPE